MGRAAIQAKLTSRNLYEMRWVAPESNENQKPTKQQMAIQIIKGKQARPQKVVIYGVEGVGKTKLASTLPAPVFIDVERGTDQLDVDRLRANTIGDVREALGYLMKNPGDYKTIVVDTIDWVERRLMQDLCIRDNVETIVEVGGGYGKGYDRLAEDLMELLGLLDKVRAKGFHIVLLAHAKISRFQDPEQSADYDRYSLKMEKKCEALVKEWCDELYFANFVTRVVVEKGKSTGKGTGQDERVIYTRRHAARDAKTREAIPVKIKLPDGVFPKELKPVFYQEESAGAAEDTPAPTKEEVKAKSDRDDLDMVVARCGGEDRVNAFLVSKQEIEPGESVWTDLDDSYKARVIKNPDTFVKAVEDYHGKTAE